MDIISRDTGLNQHISLRDSHYNVSLCYVFMFKISVVSATDASNNI